MEKETTDFLNEKSTVNPAIGEVEKSNSVMLYLNRNVGDKDQRIFVIGDTDCIANLELGTSRAGLNGANFNLITEVFRMFSYNEYPVETYRPRSTDNELYISLEAMPFVSTFFTWIFPLSLLALSIFILISRKRK